MAIMYIDGGGTKPYDQPPGDIDQLMLKTMCLESHLVTVGLYQIPNERITFSGDPDHSRTEDGSMCVRCVCVGLCSWCGVGCGVVPVCVSVNCSERTNVVLWISCSCVGTCV
jgi:PhoPQ-activated pathogenicity-related protein